MTLVKKLPSAHNKRQVTTLISRGSRYNLLASFVLKTWRSDLRHRGKNNQPREYQLFELVLSFSLKKHNGCWIRFGCRYDRNRNMIFLKLNENRNDVFDRNWHIASYQFNQLLYCFFFFSNYYV